MKTTAPPKLPSLLAAGLMTAMAAMATPLQAATLTFEATQSGFIRGSESSSAGSFAGNSVITGDTASGTQRYINSLLRFDLSSLVIPDDMIISEVSITFTIAQADAGSVNQTVTFELYQMLQNFTTGATWNTYNSSSSWSEAGGVGTSDRGSAPISTLDINPSTLAAGDTAVIQSNAAFIALIEGAAGGTLDFWFGLSAADLDDSRHVMHFARHNHATYEGATLSITYQVVPEPSALLFGGIAFAGIIVLRHKGKRA